jgi:antitoxin component YwqK of YwqJK toxin-antitoxin module
MQTIYALFSRGGKLIAFYLLFLLLFPSCSNNYNPDSKLIMVKDGLICSIKNGKPFTGRVSDVLSGQLLEYDVVRGIKNGEFHISSRDGNNIILGEIKDNKNVGLWQYFYPNGHLESRGYFNNDKVEDKWVWYFPDGKLKAEGEYHNGVKDGKWTLYDKSGRILSETVYRNDKKVVGMENLSI